MFTVAMLCRLGIACNEKTKAYDDNAVYCRTASLGRKSYCWTTSIIKMAAGTICCFVPELRPIFS